MLAQMPPPTNGIPEAQRACQRRGSLALPLSPLGLIGRRGLLKMTEWMLWYMIVFVAFAILVNVLDPDEWRQKSSTHGVPGRGGRGTHGVPGLFVYRTHEVLRR